MRVVSSRMLLVASLAAASLAAPSPAAAVTLGQIGTPSSTCGPSEWLTPPGNLGNSYVVPTTDGIGAWTVTSWSHQARAGAGQRMKLKVYRPLGGTTYLIVSQDAPRDIAESALNTFPTSLAAKPGDIVGFTVLAGTVGCGIAPVGQPYHFGAGDFPDGATATLTAASGQRLNLSAEVQPTNAFSIAKTKRNENRGTATVTLEVPNPGRVAVSGKSAREASSATTAKSVPAAGQVRLTIKAKGKKLARLNEEGKVKIKAVFKYTPTGGSSNKLPKKLKLRDR